MGRLLDAILAAAERRAPAGVGPGELRPLEPRWAPLVVSWVRDDDELFTLAPKTPAPLDCQKVLAWARPGGSQLLYRPADAAEPRAYIELNPVPYGERLWWIGHFLVAPEHRGRGLGRRILSQVLDEAFLRRRARVVSLVVFPWNIGAIRCYRRAGLSERGEVFREFAARPGRHRLIYMSIDRHEHGSHRQTAQLLPPNV